MTKTSFRCAALAKLQPLTQGFLFFFESGTTNLYKIDLNNLKNDGQNLKNNFNKIEMDIETTIPDWHGSIATSTGSIYLIGGVDMVNSNLSSAKTYLYREDINGFVRKNNLIIPREAFSLIYVNGKIFVIGGITSGKGVISDCEVYDIESDEWKMIERLNTRACQVAICSFKNKYIYKFGGLESKSKEGAKHSESIEKYIIRENKWIVIKPKIKDFILSAAVQINNNQMFIFGGVTTGYEKINHSFIINYDKELEQGKWEPSEKIVAINQKPLPLKEGFWNNQIIIHKGDFYCTQNIKLNDIFYGSAINQRKILRFSDNEWKVLN